jgi:hypothetical protein
MSVVLTLKRRRVRLRREGHRLQDHAVLVLVGERLQGGQRMLVRRREVKRLHRVDVLDRLLGHVAQPATNDLRPAGRLLGMDRELQLPPRLVNAREGELPDHVVERRAQVVDEVAHQHAEAQRRGGHRLHEHVEVRRVLDDLAPQTCGAAIQVGGDLLLDGLARLVGAVDLRLEVLARHAASFAAAPAVPVAPPDG